MKIFIWNRLNSLTENYHEEGGLVVVAESLEKALEMADCDEARTTAPNKVLDLAGSPEPFVIIFPDAGCC